MPVNNARRNPFLLAPALTFVVLALFAILRFIDLGAIGTAGYFVMALMILVAFGVPSAGYLALRGADSIGKMGIRALSGREVAVTAAGALVLILQTWILRFGVFTVDFDYTVFSLYGSTFPALPTSFGEFLLMLLFLVCLPAVCEEFFFRGIVMYEYRHAGAVGQIVASAFLFAMFTLDFAQFPVTFFAGILLAYIVFLTGNPLCAVLIHIAANLAALFVERVVWLMWLSPDSRVLFWLLLILLYFAALYFWLRTSEKLLRRRADANDEPPTRVARGKILRVLYDVISAPALLADILIFAVVALIGIFL